MAHYRTLGEWTAEGMKEIDRYDVLCRLGRMIDAGERIGNDPSEIAFDEAGEIHIAPPEDPVNLALWPPEGIRAALRGASYSPGKEQGWFLLGMLAYYIYNGRDYYTAKGIRLLEEGVDSFFGSRPNVIPLRDAGEVPFAHALNDMTAVDSTKRQKGYEKFREFVKHKAPGLFGRRRNSGEGRR